MTMNEMNGNKEKAKFYFDKKISVHVDLFSGSFYNGLIMEFGDDSFIVNDRIEGETPISFHEIKFIDRFRGKR